MSYSGTFSSMTDKQVTLQTTKGPWSMFYPKDLAPRLQSIAPGTPIEFEAGKPEGKNYWRLTSFTTPQGAQQGYQQPQPVGQYVQAPLPQHAPPPPAAVPTYQPDGDLQSENIFVTGIVGRAMQSGNFSIAEIPELTNAAIRAWRGRGAT